MSDDVTAAVRRPTCECGYDLRGLPAGGRCPECGRPVADAVDTATRTSVRRWRRRAKFGGALLFASWVIWTVWLLHDEPIDSGLNLVLGYLDGPRLPHPWAWLLSVFAMHGMPWTYGTRALACLGLFVMAGVPAPWRTAGSRWANGLLRAMAVAVFAGTFGPLVLSWAASSGPRVQNWLRSHEDVLERTVSVGDVLLQYTDAATWVAVGLFVAVVAAAAGRRPIGLRAGALLLAVGITTATLDHFSGVADRHYQLFHTLRIVHTALTVEGYLLVARLGWVLRPRPPTTGERASVDGP